MKRTPSGDGACCLPQADGLTYLKVGARGTHMKNYKHQARLLRAIAHPVRLQILDALAHGSACVCDLTMLTGRRQPYISQQLIVLREAGLVTQSRDGLNIRYRLVRPELKSLLEFIDPVCRRRFENGMTGKQ